MGYSESVAELPPSQWDQWDWEFWGQMRAAAEEEARQRQDDGWEDPGHDERSDL